MRAWKKKMKCFNAVMHPHSRYEKTKENILHKFFFYKQFLCIYFWEILYLDYWWGKLPLISILSFKFICPRESLWGEGVSNHRHPTPPPATPKIRQCMYNRCSGIIEKTFHTCMVTGSHFLTTVWWYSLLCYFISMWWNHSRSWFKSIYFDIFFLSSIKIDSSLSWIVRLSTCGILRLHHQSHGEIRSVERTRSCVSWQWSKS